MTCHGTCPRWIGPAAVAVMVLLSSLAQGVSLQPVMILTGENAGQIFGGQLWDGRDAAGRGVSSGMYFLNLKTEGQERRLKVVVVP